MKTTLSHYLKNNQNRFLEELSQWLRIPSISALPEHSDDVAKAAEWVKKKLLNIGFPKAEIIPTGRHPLVLGEWFVDDNQPTLLCYGHYDVQPVDPLAEWHSDPFEPVVKNGNIYARGACDDKSQVYLILAALEAFAQIEGKPPINIKILLEGEEESGGESIDAYVRQNGEALQADAALICDTPIVDANQPSIVNGLRGLLYTEIKVIGPRRDLHSGTYGGIAPNPLHCLCLLISRLKGEDGKINIDQLEAAIPPSTDKEKEFWNKDPLHLNEAFMNEMGVEQLVGEAEYPPLERVGDRPTLEVHGIAGGFTGDGAKTVIPAEAMAKISLRLTAGMDPSLVFTWLEQAVANHMPSGYKYTIKQLAGGEGVRVDPDNPYIQAAAQSLKTTYGKEVFFMREGGSIPIAALFDQVLKLPVILMGFGLPDDGIHAPNEKFSLDQFSKGMQTVAHYLATIQRE